MTERGIPRPHYAILSPTSEPIGEVTSGTQSPLLRKGIGLGYVPNQPAYTQEGASLLIDVRGRPHAAQVKKPPLHRSK